VPPGASSHFP